MRTRKLWWWLLVVVSVTIPLAASAQTKPLPSQQNNEGQVMVTVTPSTLSSAAATWRFDVQLNTHVAPLTQDLAKVSSLSDGKGHDEQPVAWQGDPPGGHHRNSGLYEVNIRLALPNGREVNVDRTALEDVRHSDLTFAINDAFKRARRQLQDQVSRMQGYVKEH